MNDSSYYQKKRKAENHEKNKYKPKQAISEEKITVIILGIGFLILIVFLFVMLAKALEDGKNECESQGGEWHSTNAGKIVIANCAYE